MSIDNELQKNQLQQSNNVNIIAHGGLTEITCAIGEYWAISSEQPWYYHATFIATSIGIGIGMYYQLKKN
jgi:hypothetical protein